MTTVTSATSGKTTNFAEKNAIENVYFFFTYERCRRRLSSIKMINGAEELLILLSTAFGYEYLFWRVVFRVLKVRLFKDSIGLSAHDKKKKDDKPKKTGTKMFQQKCLGVVWGLRYGSTTLVLRQYEGSTPKFFLSQNIFWHRDNFQTKIRQLELHTYIYNNNSCFYRLHYSFWHIIPWVWPPRWGRPFLFFEKKKKLWKSSPHLGVQTVPLWCKPSP